MNKTSIVLLLSLVGLLTMSSYMSAKPIEQTPFLQAAKTTKASKTVAQANTDDLIPTDDQLPTIDPTDDQLPIDDGEISVKQEDEEEEKVVVAKKTTKKAAAKKVVVVKQEEEDDEEEEKVVVAKKVVAKKAAKKVVKQEAEEEEEEEEDDETAKKTAAKQAAEKKSAMKTTKKALVKTQKPEREDEDAFDASEAYTKPKYVKKLAAYSNSTYSQYYNGTYVFKSQNWTCQADQRKSYGTTPVVATNVFNASSLLRYFDLQLPYYTAPTQYFTWDTYFGELYRPTTLALKSNLTTFDYAVVCKRWN